MFLIRADGNAEIGAGHLMRCLTVAEELAKEHVCFVCADEQSALLARERGFRSHVLGTDYREMESELPLWRRLVETVPGAGAGGRTILADSYHVTDRYLETLGQLGRVVLMEDFGTRCYPVDCVVNYNAPARLSDYEKLYQGRAVRLLIGSRYVPLRRQFRVPVADCRSREEARDILITAGGGDSGNIAGKILEKIYDTDHVFHLVTGRFNPFFHQLKAAEAKFANVHIYYDVADMAGLMLQCDMAVTAGGTTVYELAALGVPFLCFACAENQEALTEYIGRRGIAGAAGAWHRNPEGTLDRLAALFAEWSGSLEMRVLAGERARAMADGRGAVRIARELENFR